MNGNRKLEVVLEGLDTPEQGQEFADVARQHLADLVLGKQVYIEYTSMQISGPIIGKVFCNKMDVGMQVIRDGVGWYDRSANTSLTDLERRLYSQSEEAARSERRGMWQNGSPMPPWEWRRAQAAQVTAAYQMMANKLGTSRSSLRTEDVLAGRSRNSRGSGRVRKAASVPKPTQKPLNSPGQDFDFQSYLTQGRISVVYFYADWCPACRQVTPVMEMVNRAYPDMQVLFMNISEWESPLARRYAISFVPYLKIYDEQGQLLAEGKAAMGWFQQNLQQRAQRSH